MASGYRFITTSCRAVRLAMVIAFARQSSHASIRGRDRGRDRSSFPVNGVGRGRCWHSSGVRGVLDDDFVIAGLEKLPPRRGSPKTVSIISMQFRLELV